MKFYRVFLQFKRINIESECPIFKEFLIDIHNLAKTEKEKIEKIVNEMVKRAPHNKADIYEHYEEQYDIYQTKYVELANNSMLVTAYSFFETQFKQTDGIVESYLLKKHTKRKAPKQDKRSYTQKTKDSIYDVTQLDFSSLNNLWDQLDKLRTVRNLITHNGSSVFQDDGKSARDIENLKIVSSIPEITIKPNMDFFINDNKLVLDFIDTSEKYLKGVIAILQTINSADTN